MCRVLRVVVLAPADRQLEVRRAVSALDYEVVGAFERPEEVDLAADVALALEPDDQTVAALRDRGLKVAAVGGSPADLDLEEPADFRARVWELFRA